MTPRIAHEGGTSANRAKRMNRLLPLACLGVVTLLACVSCVENDPHVRAAAVHKLTDQTLLAKIAVEDGDWLVRRDAAAECGCSTTRTAIEG